MNNQTDEKIGTKKKTSPEVIDPRELGKLLRFFGGASILAAMGTFLLQRWGIEDDWVRYVVLLGVTVALAVTGVFGGLRYREGKGARALIGIVLSSVPIHFAITGGLLYSRYALDDLGVAFSGATRWVAGSPLEALLPAALALAFLVPAVWLGTRVMFRSASKRVALAILGASLLIWVPVREPMLVALVAAAAVAIGAWGEYGAGKTGTLGHTLEARWMRGLLFAPGALILTRQLVVYGAHYALIGTLAVGLCISMLYVASRLEPDGHKQNPLSSVLETLSLFPLTLAWGCLAFYLYEGDAMREALTLAVVSVGIFSCAVAIARARLRSWAIVLTTGGALAGLGLLISGLIGGGFWVSLSAIAVGAVLASAGYMSRKVLLTVMGGAVAAPALVWHFFATLEDGSFLGWGGLVIAGFTSILGAAAVERVFNSVSVGQTNQVPGKV